MTHLLDDVFDVNDVIGEPRLHAEKIGIFVIFIILLLSLCSFVPKNGHKDMISQCLV